MGLTRTWAVFGFFEGVPLLVERCASQASAVRLANDRAEADGAEYRVVEQLLPAEALARWLIDRVRSRSTP
jgi:hypothetical protein